MVTPPYKENYSVAATDVSDDGSQLLVNSLGNFLTPRGTLPEGTGLLGNAYRTVRTGAGWRAMPVDAPFSQYPDIEVRSMSSDFAGSVWFANTSGQSRADVYLDRAGGAVEPVGPSAPPGVSENALNLAGASNDLSHAVFIARSPNVGLEENQLWPGDTSLGERRPSLYEYSGTGNAEPELVGVKNQTSLAGAAQTEGKSHINEAAELISNCGTEFGSMPEGQRYNAISDSGATVFFTAAACGGAPAANELYARLDQEKTVAISEPSLLVPGRVCTGACAAAENSPGGRQAGVFTGASQDGSRVFFTTQQSLVDGDESGEGAGVDLYEADIEEGAVTRLVQASRGGPGDPTPGSGAEVQGVARISQDGSRVYFVARGVLTGANGEGARPVGGSRNLYVVTRSCPGGEKPCGAPVEQTSFVATLAEADAGDWSPHDSRPVQATAPDGHFLVFQSTAPLTADQHGLTEAGQVFEYDAQTERLVRVSRGQAGYNADGNSIAYPATIPIQGYQTDGPTNRSTHLAVSADGSRVFFSSENALTPQSLSGTINVYEYRDGQVSLISDGREVAVNGQLATRLVGTDESGEDVFFTTADPLVPQDTDAQVDVYDARIGGGFVSAPTLASCSPGACRGPAGESLAAPFPPASTSVAAEAPGGAPTGGRGAPPKRKVVKRHRVVKRKVKKHRGASGKGKAHKGSVPKGGTKAGGN